MTVKQLLISLNCTVKYASRGIKQNDVSRKPFIHRKDQDERDEVFL